MGSSGSCSSCSSSSSSKKYADIDGYQTNGGTILYNLIVKENKVLT